VPEATLRITSANLYTRAGDFVASIELPPFNPPADVVIWGQRTFVFAEPILGIEPYLRYREGLAWWCPGVALSAFHGAETGAV
jgi:hypothetical protein